MEAIGATASLITVLAVAKEILTIATGLSRDVKNASRELIQVANQMSLISLELDCLKQMEHDGNLSCLLTSEETSLLIRSLQFARKNITSLHETCNKCLQANGRLPSRLNWALFDSKTVAIALNELQRIEGHLLLVTQIINMKRGNQAHVENAHQIALVLHELKSYHQEVQGQTKGYQPTPRSGIFNAEIDMAVAFRHKSSFMLPNSWRQTLGLDLWVTTAQNDFQAAYDVYARIPMPTLWGRMGLVISLTLRRSWGLAPNISVTSGGLNFANVVPVESETVEACKRGDLLAVRDLFLQKKAAPNDITTDDRSLLYYAAQSGSVEVIQFLVNAGAPLRSNQLLAAAYWRQPETARILLRRGINVEISDHKGRTAALFLFGPSRPRSSQTEFIDILACNSFSQFNAQNETGWTVLHRAAAWGTAADVHALLQIHASASSRTKKLSWTPLMCAVCYKNFETLKVLWIVPNELSPEEEQDHRGWNLLHIAAGYGNFEAVPFLLEHGVDIEAVSQVTSRFVPPNVRGRAVTPGEVARSCGKEAYVQWTQAVNGAGFEVDMPPDTINWSTNYLDGQLGQCECCDNWDSVPHADDKR